MTLSTNQVANIAGVSLRQLQWWDERRVVQPHHHGHRRIYSNQEAIEVSVIAELRRRGMSLQAIRKPLRQMQRELQRYEEHTGELWLVIDPSTSRARHPTKIATDAYEVLEAMKHERAMHVINLADILRRVLEPQRRAPSASTITRFQ